MATSIATSRRDWAPATVPASSSERTTTSAGETVRAPMTMPAASPVLIEIAHALAGKPLGKTLELVAYTLEEPPYFGTDAMGSARHARQLSTQGVEVEVMISLEMLGYYDTEEGSQKYPVDTMAAVYPTTGDYLAVVGRLDDCAIVKAVESSARRDTAHSSRDLVRTVVSRRRFALRSPELLERRNERDHGHRHRVLSKSALPRELRHVRHSRLSANGDGQRVA